jgi:hypothetical protein
MKFLVCNINTEWPCEFVDRLVKTDKEALFEALFKRMEGSV